MDSESAVRSGSNPKPILCVGLLCMDIINLCDHYPEEDEDARANAQRWGSGGNAANTSIVLSLLKRRCEFLGTLGHGMETDFSVSQLDKHGIVHDHCVYHTDCTLPTSYITLNTSNGSRTIVHYRNLPELSVEDFSKIDLSRYSWIHFEGRSPVNYSKMIERVISYRARCGEAERGGEGEEGRKVGPGVSVEIERPGPERAQLAPLADVVMLSKDYAQYRDYQTMEQAAVEFRPSARTDAVVVCAWGVKGAAATDSEGKLHTSPSFPPPTVKDTIGAGDTFNAGLIHRLSTGHSTSDALTFACRLAGAKCGMSGFEDLATHFRN